MYQEGKFTGHIIGHTDDAGAGDTFGLSSGTGNLGEHVVGVDDIDLNLHLVHVVAFEARCCVEGTL